MATTSQNIESIANNVANIVKEVSNIAFSNNSESVQQIKSDILTVNNSLQAHTTDSLAHKKRYAEFYSYIDTAQWLNYWASNGFPSSPKIYSIVHITDLHGDKDRLNTALVVAENIDALCVINTGDSVLDKTTDDFTFTTSTVNSHNKPYLNVLGNHDVVHGTLQSDQYVFDKFIAPFSTKYEYVLGSVNGSYYYKDYSNQKQRIICLNQYLNLTRTYKSEQLSWLVNVLSNTPSGYAILICFHELEALPQKIDGNDAFYSTLWTFRGTYGGYFLSNIIDAFISRESGTIQASRHNDVAIQYDFSSVPSDIDFLGYICGHTHQDFIGVVPNTRHKQLVFVNTNSKLRNDANDLHRVIGTNTEDAFNVYCINRRDKEIRVVRFGANLSNDMRERKYMAISYVE